MSRPHIAISLILFVTPLAAAPLRFLPWDDGISARKIGFQSSAGMTELKDLHPQKRSKPLPSGSAEVPLQLIAMDRKGPEGKPLALEFKVAANIASPLVLILPDSKDPSGFRTFVVDDDTTNFSWGTQRFINATGKSLLISYEKTVAEVPGNWTPIDIKPAGAARNTLVRFAAKENTASILYNSVWEFDPDVRQLVFIVSGDDDRNGVIQLKAVIENRRGMDPVVKSNDTP